MTLPEISCVLQEAVLGTSQAVSPPALRLRGHEAQLVLQRPVVWDLECEGRWARSSPFPERRRPLTCS